MFRALKILLSLLGLLPVACARETRTNTAPGQVLCELIALDLSTDTDAMASFRASNGTDAPVSYRGYSEEGPLYQCEVLEAGVWQANPLGWCGTGLEKHALEPGERMDFSAVVPRDGRSYRFRFGAPPVLTPPISATPK